MMEESDEGQSQVNIFLSERPTADLAADIVDKIIANALKNGVNEHYDAVSGTPLGVTFLGMSCTIATLMLDGLSRAYSIRAKRK
jgi:hypothetical protein